MTGLLVLNRKLENRAGWDRAYHIRRKEKIVLYLQIAAIHFSKLAGLQCQRILLECRHPMYPFRHGAFIAMSLSVILLHTIITAIQLNLGYDKYLVELP